MGGRTFDDIEFDTYTIENTDGFTVARACPNIPLLHSAGVTSELELVLVSAPANTLRVTVQTSTGEPLPGATVDLSRTAFSDSAVTDACGQVFFSSGLTAASDYDLTVSRAGYSTESINPYDIDGESSTTIVVTEL